MTTEREELYRHVPLPGDPITLGYLPLFVDDGILEDEYISWEVHRLFLNLLGSPSGIQVEHLRQWLIALTRDDSPDATN